MHEKELDKRDREILKAVIRNYIDTGEPVGSRTIAKLHPEGLSPATVRNIMADLEEAGYLTHPHTSAGRVPTDRGYRYYVDSLLAGTELHRSDREKVAEVLRRPASLLRHIEFVALGPRRILAILVDRSGVIHNRIAEMSEDFTQEELDRIGRYLVVEFQGKTLTEIRAGLLDRMRQEKAAFDTLLSRAIALGNQVLQAPEEKDEKQVYLRGTPNILQQPEFADMDEMRRLFETFEAKGKLVKILDEVMALDGLRVVIGSEHPDPDLAHISLIASPYRVADRIGGSLGILGPTRMEYARAIALVDYISKLFSRILTDPPA